MHQLKTEIEGLLQVTSAWFTSDSCLLRDHVLHITDCADYKTKTPNLLLNESYWIISWQRRLTWCEHTDGRDWKCNFVSFLRNHNIFFWISMMKAKLIHWIMITVALLVSWCRLNIYSYHNEIYWNMIW